MVFNRETPEVRAILVQEPDPYLHAIDCGLALANLMLGRVFGDTSKTPTEASIEKGIEAIQSSSREKQRHAAVLVIEISGEVQADLTQPHQELAGYVVGFDLYDQTHVRNQDAPVIASLVTSITLALGRPEPIDRLREGIYLLDDSGKIHYSYSLVGRASARVASPFKDEMADRTEQIADRLIDRPELHRVVRLMLEAFEKEADPLRSFLSAWSALEIFINKVFTGYEEQFKADLLLEGHSAALEFYLDRVSEVMKSRYRILDRFNIVSHFLAEDTALQDREEFKALKDRRDLLLHGQEVSEKDLDSHKLMDLLSRYLQAHLIYVGLK